MSPQEILALFVANEHDPRAFMRRPILRGDWIYATNGHVVVRIPKQDGIEAHETDSIPKMPAIFDDNQREDVAKLPRLPVAEKCYACDGTGHKFKCQDCDGEGEFDYGRHTYTCKECNGSGQVDNGEEEYKQPCCNCGGTGDAQQPVQIDNQQFDRRYLEKITQLPGAKFSTHPYPMGTGYFVFDGGEGCIMPMRP